MKTVALGDVVDFYSGGTPAKSKPNLWDGDFPWFSAKDIKRPRLTDSADHISEEVFNATSLRKIPAGTVVMVVRGMILAHTVPIAVLDVDASINQDLKALLPRREIDATYLAAVLRAQHHTILSQVSTAAHGTKKLESRVLENVRIPLPSLDEQRRIAEILDQAEAIRAMRRQVLTHLNILSQSIFNDMFGQLGATRPMSDCVNEFRYGTSNKSATAGEITLRIPNVIGDSLNLTDLKKVPVTTAEFERLRLREGDVLFVRSNGNPDNVGRCAAFDPVAVRSAGLDAGRVIYASYLIRARLDNVHPAFLTTYLASDAGRRQLRDRSKTSAGQYNINIEGLSSVLIPNATVADQHTFANRVKKVHTQRSIELRALNAYNELFVSLQSRAFRGEL